MKQTVGIIFGGKSNEYEISLRTCHSILSQIDQSKFDVVPIGISKKGSWYICPPDPHTIINDRWLENSHPAIISPDPAHHGVICLEDNGCTQIRLDAIFPAVHGQNCEDGVLQGLFELAGIPYVGCGVSSSACCFDKELTHTILEAQGIPMAKSKTIKRWKYTSPTQTEKELKNSIGYPMFVKPCSSGSSVGVSRADNAEMLHDALLLAFAEGDKVIVEQMIVGHEVECAVLGNLDTIAPVVGEVETSDGFYDFDAKYVNTTANIVIPAKIDQAISTEICTMAQKIFSQLGCRGLARVDFFVTPQNKIIFNEINTMPGFTSISMYPKMITHSTMSYTDLITRLIQLAIENKKGAI